MTDHKREIEKISYHENSPLMPGKPWRCHIFTKDGSHYEGEGYSKEEARENAMDVLRANN